MSNRKVNGAEFSNGFALFELANGIVVDLSRIVIIESPQGYEGLSNVTCTKCSFKVNREERDKLISAWMEYKNSQDIGNHLSYIAFQLDNLSNATRGN
ncbi:hypothetical protein [Hafnia phage yong3]|nr:hypothetical protein [Hafnia phage yong3]